MQLNIKADEGYEEKVKQYYSKHSTYHKGDAGLDLFILQDQTIPWNSRGVTINLGIRCEAYLSETSTFTKPTSFMLVPRSSISNTPIRLSNSIGIIDSGYRGPLIAKVDNIGDGDYNLREGDRYFQIIAPALQSIDCKIVDKLSSSSRGEGGFGSTN